MDLFVCHALFLTTLRQLVKKAKHDAVQFSHASSFLPQKNNNYLSCCHVFGVVVLLVLFSAAYLMIVDLLLTCELTSKLS